MAVKYIKTKITHIRLADPELRLLPIPLPPLTLQVARTHDVAGGGVTGLDWTVYIWLLSTQSLTQSVSVSVSTNSWLSSLSLSLLTRPAQLPVLCWLAAAVGSARLSYLLFNRSCSCSSSCSTNNQGSSFFT